MQHSKLSTLKALHEMIAPNGTANLAADELGLLIEAAEILVKSADGYTVYSHIIQNIVRQLKAPSEE